MASAAAAAYRALLKAQRGLFASDRVGRAAAHAETRTHFLANKDVPSKEAAALIADAHETAGFLRTNVAQSVRNDRGNYELRVTKDHVHQSESPPPMPDWAGSLNK